jgi:hypothetical protein
VINLHLDALSTLFSTSGISSNVLYPSLDCIEKSHAIEINNRRSNSRSNKQASRRRQQLLQQRSASNAAKKAASKDKYHKVDRTATRTPPASPPGSPPASALATRPAAQPQSICPRLKNGISRCTRAVSSAARKVHSSVTAAGRSLSAGVKERKCFSVHTGHR